MDATPGPERRVAVLLAGGTGTRTGLDRPKQLVEVAGRTLLEHALRALHDHPDVDEVLVVMAPDHLDAARAVAAGYAKVTAVLAGGETRTASTLAALAHLGDTDCLLLLHDAARPLLPARVVSDCLAALAGHGAVATVIPSTDTVFEVGPDGTIRGVPAREGLRRAQTPQGFHAAVLRRAYAAAATDPEFVATDDCSVVHRYLPDVPVAVVDGDESLLKVTSRLDLVVVEELLRRRGGG
jgi:2-C-methyl-D-erythritol 4-phosphate cytidylyltransferase